MGRCHRCHDVILPSAPGCDRCGHLSDDAFNRAVEASRGARAAEGRRALAWFGATLVPVALIPVTIELWWTWFERPPDRWPHPAGLGLEVVIIALLVAATACFDRARTWWDRSRVRQHLPPRQPARARVPAPGVDIRVG